MWCHFYSKEENGLATFDIDGAVTTIVEMLQPKSVSDLGINPAVYDNDRQVRPGTQTEEAVASRKFEKVQVIVWIPGQDILVDLYDVHEYTLSIPVTQVSDTYADLDAILKR